MYVLVALFSVIIASIYFFFKQRYTYWLKKGVQQLEPSFPFGDLHEPLRVPRIIRFAKCYQAFKKRGLKYGGIYLYFMPVYMVVDPEHVKNILVKDFQNFNTRGLYHNEEKQPSSVNLISISGPRWKNLRNKLTPTFTSGKMKMMFATTSQCTLPMIKAVGKMAANEEAIDAKDTVARFTTDVIGSCAFGFECNSFEAPNTDFRKYGTSILPTTPFEEMKFIFSTIFQGLSRKLGITPMNPVAVNFFEKIALETYNYRKTNNIQRNDFMQILIEMKDKENDPEQKENSISMNELVAQVLLFFVAGFDTSSVTLSFCLFNLATNFDVQDKLRQEIRRILNKNNGELSYEALQDLKYTEQVINETMRLYPIAAVIGRRCTEEYKIPSTDAVIEKGTQILISPWGLHRDPEYYPDPDKFDPERFSDENKQSIVPGTFLPFGDGPRICIGIRFAMMQMKICLAALLKDYEFSLDPKTRLPLGLDFGFTITPKGGIWLNAKKIS